MPRSKIPKKTPKVHSIADALDDGRLSAPSALRNCAPICDAMAGYVPKQGRALEVASGTGQHVIAYARVFPDVTWQPTDIDAARLNSVNAWAALEGLPNLLAAHMLNASQPDWNIGAFDLVTVTNLFHLISESAATNVIVGAARALRPDGVFFVYGPFRNSGVFRSHGDQEFHMRLQESDASAGYKDLEWMQAQAGGAGLTLLAEIEMPANNLLLVWRKPA